MTRKMNRISGIRIILLLFVLSLFSVLGIERMVWEGKRNTLKKQTIADEDFRENFFSDQMRREKDSLSSPCKALLKNVETETVYFPIPESTVDPSLKISFVDSWMSERNYRGKSKHEGVDLMASKNKRGLYPVLSMTDGTVSNLGWLEKGGCRVGITSKSGTYYYYAHLDTYSNIKRGDFVHAGDLLGYMGDSGYGKEGTKGEFAVHLHIGIYVWENEKEVSVNPFYVLKYLENNKLKYAYF